MEIIISGADETFINEQVNAGRFPDPRTVVSRALQALRNSDNSEVSDPVGLRDAVMAGIEDLENGRSDIWNAEEIKAEGRRLLAARKAK